MSPHAGEEEGRGGISTWSSKLFYIFLLEDKRRWQLVRIETGKRRILFFIFDVVTKERKKFIMVLRKQIST